MLALAVAAPGRGMALAPEFAANAELITLTASLGDHRQQLTLIDPRQRVMSVYHVDAATGEIALKSVRNFQWDMQLHEFNSAKPLPRDIRSLVEQK
jgi:hypothetical protein